MFGRLVAGLIVVGLAIGVWALWPAGDSGTTTTTEVHAAVTSTLPETTSTSTTVASTSTTDATEVAVIETVEQAEDLLRSFWFAWFEGIYNRDEERIREAVGNQQLLDSARSQFGIMEFATAPSFEGTVLEDTEILLSDSSCAALWSLVSSSFRDGETRGVHVFRSTAQGWLVVNVWPLRDDLWSQDCETQLEPLS